MADVNSRDAGLIHKPRNWDQWENMCAKIYGDFFYSSARRFGRHGQNQEGLDILVHDFRGTPGKGAGMVFVQCKYVENGKLDFSTVEGDVLRARNKIRDKRDYEAVYLYIVATNANNDVKLHNSLQALKTEEDLPFAIELHSWDKICGLIQTSNWLWELYGQEPGSEIDPDDSVEAQHNASLIRSYLDEDLLVEARRSDLERRSKLLGHGHGSSPEQTSKEIWRYSPALRKVLLNLYTRAADSQAALELAKFEYGLDKRNAKKCLDYYRLLRIAEHLQKSHFPTESKPRYGRWLESLAENLFEMNGRPEILACLAVILIMESDNQGIQDKAFEMMFRVRDRDSDSQWRIASEVAHAVVRYYYVVRRGWVPATKFYTIGDNVHHEQQRSGYRGQPFAHPVDAKVTMYGFDPLREPQPEPDQLIDLLARDFFHRVNPLPELKKECMIYSSGVFETFDGRDYQDTRNHSEQRVVNFQTLATAITEKQHLKLIHTHSLLITYRTFERLVGYRAYLRAYTQREAVVPQKYTDKLSAVDAIISSCRYAKNEDFLLDKGRIWVAPVYDNPPPLLENHVINQQGHFKPSPITLAHDQIDLVLQRLNAMNAVERKDFERFYSLRDNELSLCCLLALHRQRTLLSYSWIDRSVAAFMGIGSSYPLR